LKLGHLAENVIGAQIPRFQVDIALEREGRMEGQTRARWGKWANGQMAQLYGAIFINLSTGRRHLAHMKAFSVTVHPKLLVYENWNTWRLT
jgi:hypothetical protein